jgi:hypothetical protein
MSDIPKETDPKDAKLINRTPDVKNVSGIQGFAERYKADLSNDLADDLEAFKNRPMPPYVDVDPIEQKKLQASIEKERSIADQHAQKIIDSKVQDNQEWQKGIDFLHKESKHSVYETMEVLDSFKSPPNVETVQMSFIGYRRWGGAAGERSRWLATDVFDQEEHVNLYDLPNSNTAQNTAAWRVEAGNRILRGRADSKFGHDGGGEQVYVPDEKLLSYASPDEVKKMGVTDEN